MKITELKTDIFAKALAGVQIVPNPDMIPTAMDIANMFGDIQMSITASLEPVELLYMLESNHDLIFTENDLWRIELQLPDIVYCFPTSAFEAMYLENNTPSQIMQDDAVLSMLATALSQKAQQRFGTNGFIHNYISEGPKVFQGWNMDLLNVDDACLPPVNPSNDSLKELNDLFEKETLKTMEAAQFEKDGTTHSLFVVHAIFSKRITYSELIKLLKTNMVHIKNISYGIKQLINDKYLTENMYEITQQKNILGNPYDVYEFDLSAVNEVMQSVAKFPVVVQVCGTYNVYDNKVVPCEDGGPFQKFIDMIMLPNLQTAWDEYITHHPTEVAMVEEESTDDEPVQEDKDIIQSMLDNCVAQNILIPPEEPEELDREDIMKDILDCVIDHAISVNGYGKGENYVEPPKTHQKPIRKPKTINIAYSVTFFVKDGSFDSLLKIETNPAYQEEGVEGIVSIGKDENGVQQFYMGHPMQSDVDEQVRYRWSRKTYEQLFKDVGVYKVKDLLDNNGVLTDSNVEITRDMFEEETDEE